MHTRLMLGPVAVQMVFVIQRGDCSHFGVCHDKDPAYGKLLIAAAAVGVRIIALRFSVDICPDTHAGRFTYMGPAGVNLEYRSPRGPNKVGMPYE